ncbi:MAG: tRNA (adenosine(37)-N6)-threonylcarbamoyltransferase complex dimerization subunit type 1 TsaB [Bacteroidales bacterium]|nr:tRNA (adenosine(37)-N6)-threonylcarbamoyltransferase complex dimerization subunit type 1 TsaB [Bacteroidales bacterium]
MPVILHIDTATQFCSVALSDDKTLISCKESNKKNAHSQVITMWINELLNENNLKPGMIDAVAVSKGPGSYTGLRIGVSVAKGLCFALDKPLISIGTLHSMAVGMTEGCRTEKRLADNFLFCPMIDAKRMEVYSAIFDKNNQQIREIRAEVISMDSFSEELKNHVIVFGGDGAEKCKAILTHHNAILLDAFQPSAKFMVSLAMEKFEKNDFENVAYFEPFYLKDFVAGLPRVKGLR